MLMQGLAQALPYIKELPDSGSYELTVRPFVHQLQELPWKLLAAGADAGALRQVYVETNPLVTALAFALAVTPVFLVVSEVNRNYSQVDRCWSLLPTIYLAHYCAWAHLSGLPTRRLDNLVGLSVLWSIRLTYNYWRKGGYQIGSEDYRWEIVKGKVNPAVFFLFNVTFISLAQSILLFLVATPAYTMLLATGRLGDELFTCDTVFTRLLAALVVFEWFADQQQWNYHKAKSHYKETGQAPKGYTAAEVRRGFCTSGLWAWSRHPNFAAEQAVWVAVYQWGCYTTESLWNWTALGAFSYLMLFQGSTWLTERISAGKYPQYAGYQKRVGMFLPSVVTFWTGPTAEGDTSGLVAGDEERAAAAPQAPDVKGKKRA